MNILVIGQGGREHAIIKEIKKSKELKNIFVAPGNDGIALDATCLKIDVNNFEHIFHVCTENQIDFVLIGPEEPLVNGLADYLRDKNIPVFGPSKLGAQLEGSKIFAKKFMVEAKIPTAKYQTVSSVDECKKISSNFTPPYVLKADGLAAGKGVYICKTMNELEIAASELFEKKILGTAGEKAIIEQFTPGWEMSLLLLTNGNEYELLPIAQDHKRLKDKNEGPNTGGMGTIAPLKINPSIINKIKEQVIEPTLRLIKQKNILYRGVIFLGLMIHEDQISVLEYNVRFGDPETQVILPLIDNDLAVVFNKLANGELEKIKFNNKSACCVILAAEGYPNNPKKNVEIFGELQAMNSDSYFVHAGTTKKNNTWLVNGGRVLGAVGVGNTPDEAIKKAYSFSNNVSWPGIQKRSDIGNYLPIPTNSD